MIVSIPKFVIKPNTKLIILSILLASILIIPFTGFKKYLSILLIILFAIFIYIIFINTNNQNLIDAVPSTTIPEPTHLGLDGISHNNLIAGMPNKLYY